MPVDMFSAEWLARCNIPEWKAENNGGRARREAQRKRRAPAAAARFLRALKYAGGKTKRNGTDASEVVLGLGRNRRICAFV
jgi:hypothetical protein